MCLFYFPNEMLSQNYTSKVCWSLFLMFDLLNEVGVSCEPWHIISLEFDVARVSKNLDKNQDLDYGHGDMALALGMSRSFSSKSNPNNAHKWHSILYLWDICWWSLCGRGIVYLSQFLIVLWSSSYWHQFMTVGTLWVKGKNVHISWV